MFKTSLFLPSLRAARIAVLLPAALFAGQAVAQSVPAPRAVQGQALDAAPESRAEADQSIDAALAAALIGAISNQFGERKVEVKLDRVATEPLNLIDLRVTGAGRLRIGDDDEWLPLRFAALYDSVAATVAQPRLTLGDDGTSEEIALESAMGLALRQRVVEQLAQEFAQQPAQLHLDRITQVAAGKRYARIEAVGAVDFDGQGKSLAQVSALYDRSARQWLRVGYELVGSASRVDPATSATAR